MTWPTKKHLNEVIAKQEAAFKKQVVANKALSSSLERIRQNARDCVGKNLHQNNVWTIEEVTTALTRAEEIIK